MLLLALLSASACAATVREVPTAGLPFGACESIRESISERLTYNRRYPQIRAHVDRLAAIAAGASPFRERRAALVSLRDLLATPSPLLSERIAGALAEADDAPVVLASCWRPECPLRNVWCMNAVLAYADRRHVDKPEELGTSAVLRWALAKRLLGADAAAEAKAVLATLPTPTVFEVLGGEGGIYEIARSWTDRLTSDKRLGSYFSNFSRASYLIVVHHFQRLICSAIGGTCDPPTGEYRGMSREQEEAILEGLRTAMHGRSVPAEAAQVVVAALAHKKENWLGISGAIWVKPVPR